MLHSAGVFRQENVDVELRRRKKEGDDKDDRRAVRTTAFIDEGQENSDGDLVFTNRASDSHRLDLYRYRKDVLCRR
jgi:hypothetical protein